MTKTRRTEITIEKHEITVIRRRGRRWTTWCEACQCETTAFRIDEASVLLGLTEVKIGRLAEAGEFHFIEPSGGNEPLVCGRSLGNKTRTKS